MTKYVGAKQRSERTQLQRAVLAMLTTGMMAWPSFSPVYAASASDFTGYNGHIETSTTNHHIYAGTKVNDAVGANKFTQFKVAQNEVANLHFTRWNGGSKGDNFHTLLNFVQNRIEVNGTVNALRNDRIMMERSSAARLITTVMKSKHLKTRAVKRMRPIPMRSLVGMLK